MAPITVGHVHSLAKGACLAAGVAVLSVVGYVQAQRPNTKESNPNLMKLASANSGFCFKMLNLLAGGAQHENVFISPLSISNALGMALNGARGSTRSEIAGTLGIRGMSLEDANSANKLLLDSLGAQPDKSTVSIANSVWFDRKIRVKLAFEKACSDFYNAGATRLNFEDPASAATVNSWVSEATHGRIPKIVAPDDLGGQAAVLTNAIYFKGTWTHAFQESETQQSLFYLASGQTKKVPLMHLHKSLAYADHPSYQEVEVPYGTGRLNLTVLLPHKGTATATVIRELAGESELPTVGGAQDVELYLPKFKADYKVQLNSVLKTAGMPTAFTRNADFKDMSPDAAEISKVIHIANVEVDEKGSTATAATAVTVRAMAVMRPRPVQPPIIVRVDRPFLVFIRDRQTGAILFAGAINNPA